MNRMKAEESEGKLKFKNFKSQTLLHSLHPANPVNPVYPC
jgi:hypothetical protein